MTKYDSVSIQSHDLRSKISSGELVIGIIGLGYVGLPLSLAFANSGVSTVGFDIDQSKVTLLTNQPAFLVIFLLMILNKQGLVENSVQALIFL